MKTRHILLATGMIGSLVASGAKADWASDLIYPNSYTENPGSYSFQATATGDVYAYFAGSGAGGENSISLLVNGVATPDSAAGVFDDFTTQVGQSVKLGSVNAGDTLVFRLNLVPGYYYDNYPTAWYSDVTQNGDGMNHIYSRAFAGDQGAGIPAGTYVAFEDLKKGDSDYNYYDNTFVFSTVAVPEPETYAMFMAGLGLLGVAARRRNCL
ncbi:MAG TPA: PEP-CTERM sorting domain-containing protein [Rhodocyclaceae bacterium]|nr:PEP-CTERM sorting domain-containing protein [Rhodocyclaceae bacterium]